MLDIEICKLNKDNINLFKKLQIECEQEFKYGKIPILSEEYVQEIFSSKPSEYSKDNRYLIKSSTVPVGLVIISNDCNFWKDYLANTVKFIYISKDYRCKGIATISIGELLNYHRGFWELFNKSENIVIMKLIKKVVSNVFESAPQPLNQAKQGVSGYIFYNGIDDVPVLKRKVKLELK